MDSIKLLISGYLEGELTDDELCRLTDLLQTDPDTLDRFVFNGFIHSHLLDWMDQQPLEETRLDGAFDALDAWVAPMSGYKSLPLPLGEGWREGELPAAITPSPSPLPKGEGFETSSRKRRLRAVWTMAAVAASLLVAASVSMVAYVVASRPVFVGQLTDVSNCRWGAEQAAMSLGTPLYDGQDLNLIQGSAVVTFASGAKMLLEGPAELRLDSPMEVQLIAGRIATKVPRQATGFAVNSSLARFVDLGTEFTVSLEAEKAFDVYVFEGMVEMRLNERFGKAALKPVYVPEVRAYHFDVKVGDVEPLPFDQGEKMPF